MDCKQHICAMSLLPPTSSARSLALHPSSGAREAHTADELKFALLLLVHRRGVHRLLALALVSRCRAHASVPRGRKPARARSSVVARARNFARPLQRARLRQVLDRRQRHRSKVVRTLATFLGRSPGAHARVCGRLTPADRARRIPIVPGRAALTADRRPLELAPKGSG